MFFFILSLQEADEDIRKLHKYMDEIDKLSLKMARWFCENPKTFKVSECLNLFHKLCQDVTTAKQIKRKVILVVYIISVFTASGSTRIVILGDPLYDPV